MFLLRLAKRIFSDILVRICKDRHFKVEIILLLCDATIGTLLEQFSSGDAEIAWREFLASYSDLIYTVARTFTKDSDEANDCFIYVCEKLIERNYRRLLTFKPEGIASFSTWLRAVVRNLCLDWLRSRFGRKQLFRSVASLAALEQEIFTKIFQRGLSIEQAWADLRAAGTEISYSEFETCAIRIHKLLTSRQLWLLSTSNTAIESLDDENATPQVRDVADPSPNPEQMTLLREIHSSVSMAMQKLEGGDRLLLNLRILQGLSLLQIAGLVGLKDAQTADRRIRDALQRLRKNMGLSGPIAGKAKSVSV